MVIHKSTQNADVILLQEIQNHLSNALLKRGIFDDWNTENIKFF